MKAGSPWGMMRGVGGVRKSEHQSLLAKGLGLGLLCWGFKGVQKEIRSEEASTLQIGSLTFPPGQCTSPQLNPYHRLFDQDVGIETVPKTLYSPDLAPGDFWLFPKLKGCRYETIEELKEALTKVHWHAHTRGLPCGLLEVVGTLQQVHLQSEEITSKGTSVLCVYYQ